MIGDSASVCDAYTEYMIGGGENGQ